MNIHSIPRFVILLILGALLASSSWAVETVTCLGFCPIPQNALVQLPFAAIAGDVIVQESASTTVSDVFRIFNNLVDTGGGTGLGNLAILYRGNNNLPPPASLSANVVVIKEAAAGATTYFGSIGAFRLDTGMNAVRVPQDFPTIQSAVSHAFPGDTIRVGPGRWCGALIGKPLTLVGEGATIMGCPAAPGGPVGKVYRRGFYITWYASGTSISGFVFDGAGFSNTNQSPLAIGIQSLAGANNLVVDSNTFLGGGYGVFVGGGNGAQVTHNVFDGFTVLSNGFGGAAIEDDGLPQQFGGTGRATGNVIQFNTITSTVPPGDYSSVSWTNQVDVPLAGITLSAQDGIIVSNNKTSITSNAHGDAGVGILASDYAGLTDINVAITNNDGRGSQYALIVTNDQGGGTGNSVGLTLRGNFGVNLINGSTFNVRNRSISTSLQCDPSGVCP